MSPPSFPPGWFKLEPGDAVPPVEKERRWWTPIAAAIDRWLEPRWRALLTWVVVAAIIGRLFDLGAVRWIMMGTVVILDEVSPGMREVEALLITAFTTGFVGMLLITGFPPIAMRLPWKNVVLWFLTVPLLGSVVFLGLSLAALGFQREGAGGGIAVAIAASASGLALIGARSRPWITLVAGTLAGGCVSLLPFGEGWFWLVSPAMYLIYGAVMLYGTSPLPRKAGAG